MLMDETFKPIAESVKNISEIVKGASQFLGKICNPAAEEFGYYLQDNIRQWRMKNIAKIATEAEIILKSNGTIDGLSAPPRLVYQIMEEGSLIDDKDVQKMWAGLLASSCTLDGKDESNLVYIDLLSKLTSSEVALINYLCNRTSKYTESNGLIYANSLEMDLLRTISGFEDVHVINHIVMHLKSLGLVQFNLIEITTFYGNLIPTQLCLSMYVKCQGSSDSPAEYWSECLHG